MVDTILLIAQISSSLTVLMGIIAIIFTISALKGLADDSFKTLIKRIAIFLVISLIGIASMTLYHIADSFGGLENALTIWYIFMFVAIVYSIYDSYSIIKFEKPFASISSKRTSKSKKKKL